MTSFAVFDSTNGAFDTTIVTQYLDGSTHNPLVVGPAATNSDLRVYSSDNNVTMHALAHPVHFQDSCRRVFTKMFDSVPHGVRLSEVIKPIEVKPSDVQLTLRDDGTVAFVGKIRVRTTAGRVARSVYLHYSDRYGRPSRTHIATTMGGIAYGLDDSFKVCTCRLIDSPAHKRLL
jgi:hypothetical protein